MRRRAGAAAAAALAVTVAAAAGCGGGPPADLFVVERSGSIPGARLTLRITDDGGAYCNRAKRAEITSDQLLEARELTRQLDGKGEKKGPAARNVRLPPGPVSTLRYRVRSQAGTVTFADTSPRQPQTFYRVAKLTRDVAKGDCRLPR